MMFDLAISLFLLAGFVASYRLLAGPALADRIVAMDVALISFMGAIAVDAARTNSANNLIILVVLAIIGFTATVAAARFLQHEHGEARS